MRGIRNVNTCIQYLFFEIENRKAFRNWNSLIHFTILTDSGHFVQTNNRWKYPKALFSYNLYMSYVWQSLLFSYHSLLSKHILTNKCV